MADANKQKDQRAVVKNPNNVISLEDLNHRLSQLNQTVNTKLEKMDNHLKHQRELHEKSILKRMQKMEAALAKHEAAKVK